MKKTIAVVLVCLYGLLFVGACNYDAECWAPGESTGAGVGGGVITPGAGGGYGAEPDPEPQGDVGLWTCTGHIRECSNEKDPTVRACLFMKSVGHTRVEAVALALDECSKHLSVITGAPYLCEDTSQLNCVQEPMVRWTCSGTPRCKRGTSCKEADETWINACGSTDVPVDDWTPERARQQLLDECEDTLDTQYGAPWFCMPGSLGCYLD